MTAESLISANLAFVVALLAGPPVVGALRRLQVIDHPSERSSHALPTPRGGGVSLAAGALAAAVLVPAFGGSGRTGLLVAAVGFGLLGLAEDVRGVRPLPRLTVQFAVAAVSLLWLLDGLDGPRPWQVLFGFGCLLWLVSYTNAFNFMDGINGISAAQALVAGGAWLAIGHTQGVTVLAGGGALVAAAALGFLPFNFPKATMFLGDVGSYFIGAWLAALAVVGLRAGLPPEAVLAPLAVYLTDTSTTMVRRARAGERFYTPHRKHAYQRLTQLGWSHANTTVAVAGVMAVCSILGAVSLTGSVVLRIIADVALLGVLAIYVVSPKLVARARAARTQPAVEQIERSLSLRSVGERWSRPPDDVSPAPRNGQPQHEADHDAEAVPADVGQAR